MGIQEEVSSPTYTIISEYQGRIPLYHMDAYRLAGPDDFEAIGAEEYLYGSGICVIEWSERISEVLPDTCIRIHIEITGEQRRHFLIYGMKTEEQNV